MMDRFVTFVQNREPIASVVDGEIVMLSVRAGAYFSLNSVASEIWSMLETPHSIDEICRALRAVYAIDKETAAIQVSAFLDSIATRGLIERLEPLEVLS
jgi:Coenzyme PQQ synthesis protein D (PqqD)